MDTGPSEVTVDQQRLVFLFCVRYRQVDGRRRLALGWRRTGYHERFQALVHGAEEYGVAQRADGFLESCFVARALAVAAALDERGSPETYDAILDGFSEIAEFSGRRLLYGSLSQHYLNLRAKGESRAEALEELKRAYPHSP